MDDTTAAEMPTASLSTVSAWERWVDVTFVWVPYITLAGSLVAALVGSDADGSDRSIMVLLSLAAAAWTWLTFTRLGRPSRVGQGHVRIYFAGFIVLAGALVLREQVFLIYSITGFFHGALLRPWPLAFAGFGASSLVMHSHIVITESTPATWALYLGLVVFQAAAVGLGMYFGMKVTETAEQRRAAMEQLELTMAENVGLHNQLVAQAREAGVLDERQRMAREIHDTIAQGLTGVITQIEAANQSWGDDVVVRRHLDTASNLARQSLAEARRSVQAIRPQPLEESRLPGALADVAAEWSEVAGVPVEVHTIGDRRPLRPEVEITLLRGAQEGLANVAKHAAATRVGMTLTFMDHAVGLDVRDDGRGFDPHHPPSSESVGLVAMEQRVEHVHGTVDIESAPGEGTAISIHIPTALEETDHV